ncbi:hypothetical protein ABPG72_005306 [Tetrahymena utriculariae]
MPPLKSFSNNLIYKQKIKLNLKVDFRLQMLCRKGIRKILQISKEVKFQQKKVQLPLIPPLPTEKLENKKDQLILNISQSNYKKSEKFKAVLLYNFLGKGNQSYNQNNFLAVINKNHFL